MEITMQNGSFRNTYKIDDAIFVGFGRRSRIITTLGVFQPGPQGRLVDTKSGRFMHQIVFEAEFGANTGRQIHHENGDRYDNRLVNLSSLTKEQHQRKHFGEVHNTNPYRVR